MKRILIVAFIAFAVLTMSVNAQEIKSLTVLPSESEISVGDSLQFTATLLDTTGAVIDTSLVWNIVTLENVGTVDDSGLFIAEAGGRGIIIASFGEFADSAYVTVEAEVPDDPEEPEEPVADIKTLSVALSTITDIETNVGDILQLIVLNNGVADTTATWSVVAVPADIATIDESGLFTAIASGSGMLIATVGDSTATINLIVAPVIDRVAASIEIKPGKNTVAIGDSIAFKAEIIDENGDEMEGVVIWSLSDKTLGTISESGLFYALVAGELTVIAEFGDITGESAITISDEVVDPGQGDLIRNTIQVQRELMEGQQVKLGNGKADEGDTIKITGIPNPFNFLNGTKIYFPEGSLTDNITLTVKIPKIGKIKISETNPLESDIEFPDSIMAGVSFEISVNDTVVHPYHFATPLEVTIPYRQALLDKIGITPDQLGMFFLTESGELVEEGITDIVLDEPNKLIRGTIAHFSDVVLAQKDSLSGQIERQSAQVSKGGGRIDMSTLPGLRNIGLDNLSVDIPADAVQEQLNLRINLPASIPAEKAAARAVEFTIEGHVGQFNFNKPVTITIPYPEDVVDETALTIKEWDPAGEMWNPIELVETIVVDKAANVISAQVNHFTIYGAVESDVPTIAEENGLPGGFSLAANYPNPFNPSTTISFSTPELSNVNITIFNMLGQHVVTLTDGVKPAGTYSIVWNGRNEAGMAVTSGIYFYRLETGNFSETRKMVFMR